MIDKFDNIKIKIEELSTILGFFKQSQIKKVLNEDIEKINFSYNAIKSALENLQNDYRKSQQNSEKEIESLNMLYKDIKTKFENLEQEYQQYKINTLIEKKDLKLKNEEINDQYINYQNEMKILKSVHDDLVLKNQLISKLLASSSDNYGLSLYKDVLQKDFFNFANKEESLANEAEAIFKLQSIEKELELITVYPNLYKKNVVAVGGGFSAGKSRFINSFLDDAKIKLPEGVNPTTAIPTFVMHNDNNQFIGCNHNGGVVNLYELDENFHFKLSHNFIKSFEFNLNKIMPFMIIGTAIRKFENLCFIDTPGYNPSDIDGGFTNEDKCIAEEFLGNSEVLLWLIGLDSNGTISSSDIEFLSQLDLENKSLYFVLNKADLKPKSDIESIMIQMEEILNDYEIDFIGISAYSSVKKEEISYSKISLFEFLKSIDTESEVQNNLIEKLYDVYIMYKKAILKNIKKKELIISTLNSLSLDLLQSGFDDLSNPAYQRLDKLKKLYSTKLQEENLSDLEIVIIKLKKAIDEVFGKESFIEVEKIEKNNIELNYDLSIDNGFLEDEISYNINDDEEKQKKLIELRDILKEKVNNQENNTQSSFNPFFSNWGN